MPPFHAVRRRAALRQVLRRAIVALPVVIAAPAGAQAPVARRTMTFADFAAVAAVGDPQLSPDGTRVLYALRRTDVAANRRTGATWLVPIAGGEPRRWPDDTTIASEARWSPDGRQVTWVSGGQLWVSNADGGARRRLTTLSGSATGPVWAPGSDRIAFVSRVWPGCATDACSAARTDSVEKSPVKAQVADRLMYRHWNARDDGTRGHLFVVAAAGGAPLDLMPAATYDVPPGPFGGSEGYAWSADGRELAYAAKDDRADAAWSTDVNLHLVPAGGGAARVLTAANPGADQGPVFSPDGRYLAYQSQARGGFEADRWRLMLMDRRTGTSHELLVGWDRNADAFAFAADGRSLVVTTAEAARDKLYRVRLDGAGRMVGRPQLLVGAMNNVGASLARDGRTIAWLRDAADRPAEVWTARVTDAGMAGARALTRHNARLLEDLALHPAEEIWYRGAGGDSVHALFIKPPQWQAGRRYPLLLLVHGGPQGAWLDQWHGRWSYQMMAAAGVAVLAVNPRGSTGYGQRFVDEVSRDWGGKAYEDLMLGVDASLARWPWLDGQRLGAAGGSYGGYMVNWIAGHSDRFKALVSHAGVFNLENMYGATEELWFTEWENGGPFWQDSTTLARYRQWSPHLSAGKMRTPTLVTHGELDYRVPYYESVSLFSALQRQSVPSRFVLFPDEGHWIGRPQNQRLWWAEVQGWFAKYLVADVPRS